MLIQVNNMLNVYHSIVSTYLPYGSQIYGHYKRGSKNSPHSHLGLQHRTHYRTKTTFKIGFLVNLGLIVGEAEVADHEHVGVVPTAGPGEPQKVVFIIAVVIDDSLQSDCYQCPNL